MSDIAKLKERYLEYYRDLPVQKYAAAYVGRDEDTIIRWRTDDTEFADAVDLAKVEFFKRGMKKVKTEWAYERLDREVWAPPKQEVEITNPVKEILEGFGIIRQTTTTSGTPSP